MNGFVGMNGRQRPSILFNHGTNGTIEEGVDFHHARVKIYKSSTIPRVKIIEISELAKREYSPLLVGKGDSCMRKRGGHVGMG
jgi:hypothetical protein